MLWCINSHAHRLRNCVQKPSLSWYCKTINFKAKFVTGLECWFNKPCFNITKFYFVKSEIKTKLQDCILNRLSYVLLEFVNGSSDVLLSRLLVIFHHPLFQISSQLSVQLQSQINPSDHKLYLYIILYIANKCRESLFSFIQSKVPYIKGIIQNENCVIIYPQLFFV